MSYSNSIKNYFIVFFKYGASSFWSLSLIIILKYQKFALAYQDSREKNSTYYLNLG